MRWLMKITREMMGCLREGDLIEFALDGLPAEERVKAEAHLKDCKHCQAQLRAVMEMQEGLAWRVRQESASPDLPQRMLRTVLQAKNPKP